MTDDSGILDVLKHIAQKKKWDKEKLKTLKDLEKEWGKKEISNPDDTYWGGHYDAAKEIRAEIIRYARELHKLAIFANEDKPELLYLPGGTTMRISNMEGLKMKLLVMDIFNLTEEDIK